MSKTNGKPNAGQSNIIADPRERKLRALDDVPTCPPALRSAGLEPIWLRYAKVAKKGDPAAIEKLLDLGVRYGVEGNDSRDADPETFYDEALPDDARKLMRECDAGVAACVQRVELGLPMTDLEYLIGSYALECVTNHESPVASYLWRRIDEHAQNLRQRGMLEPREWPVEKQP